MKYLLTCFIILLVLMFFSWLGAGKGLSGLMVDLADTCGRL